MISPSKKPHISIGELPMTPGGLLIISSAQGFGGSRHHRHGVHRDALVGSVEREDADLSGVYGDALCGGSLRT